MHNQKIRSKSIKTIKSKQKENTHKQQKASKQHNNTIATTTNKQPIQTQLNTIATQLNKQCTNNKNISKQGHIM